MKKKWIGVTSIVLCLVVAGYFLMQDDEIERNFYGSNDDWEVTLDFVSTMDKKYHVDHEMKWNVEYINKEKVVEQAPFQCTVVCEMETGSYSQSSGIDEWSSEQEPTHIFYSHGDEKLHESTKEYFYKERTIKSSAIISINGVEETILLVEKK